MKCKVCGNEEFVANQECRAEILVDGKGIFLDNMDGGLEANIYDSGNPYGPFTCTRCGAVYDELEEGAEVMEEPSPDWEERARRKEQRKKETLKDLLSPEKVFRWLADHDNTDDMFRIFGEMDLEGVLKSYNVPQLIQKVSDYMNRTERTSVNHESYIQNVLAISRDGSEVYTMVLSFETPGKDFDIEGAVRAAATDFCKTPYGKEVYEHNCESFNWADFNMYVPNEICTKYDFRKIDSCIGTIEVNWDERMVDNSELEDEEKEESES